MGTKGERQMGNVKLLETKTKDKVSQTWGCGCKYTHNRKIRLMTISSFTLNCNDCQNKKNEIFKYVQLQNYGLMYLNCHLIHYLSKSFRITRILFNYCGQMHMY